MSDGLISFIILEVFCILVCAFAYWAKSRQDDEPSTNGRKGSMRNHKISH